MKAYLALMRIDLKLALRNKAVLFFNYFFPLFFFFVFLPRPPTPDLSSPPPTATP